MRWFFRRVYVEVYRKSVMETQLVTLLPKTDRIYFHGEQTPPTPQADRQAGRRGPCVLRPSRHGAAEPPRCSCSRSVFLSDSSPLAGAVRTIPRPVPVPPPPPPLLCQTDRRSLEVAEGAQKRGLSSAGWGRSRGGQRDECQKTGQRQHHLTADDCFSH